MKELKIIFNNSNLEIELRDSTNKQYYREKYIPENIEQNLNNYFSVLYNSNNFKIGNSITRALKRLPSSPNTILKINQNGIWSKYTNLVEYSDLKKEVDIKLKNNNRDFSSEKELEPLYDKIKLFPENDFYFYDLASLLMQRGDFQEASDHLREAISLKEDNYLYYYSLGECYRNLGKLELALLEYKEALKLNPSHDMSAFSSAIISEEIGKLNAAIEFYHRVIINNPSFVESYLRLGKLYCKLDYFDEAIYTFEEVLFIAPENKVAIDGIEEAEKIKKKVKSTDLNNLGIAYAEKNKFDKAIEKFAKASEMIPDDMEIKYNLAYAHFKSDSLIQSSLIFREILKANPDMINIHINLAEIYIKQNLKDFAIEEYENFLRLSKDENKKNEIRTIIQRLIK
jgi:tetratricopeptide (TPR) repeat protein